MRVSDWRTGCSSYVLRPEIGSVSRSLTGLGEILRNQDSPTFANAFDKICFALARPCSNESSLADAAPTYSIDIHDELHMRLEKLAA